mmetsp:Transcript_15979/g.40098  ORF Transcript_15979/g.40098 Transcript_15979/m.40098 type:complete len:82 (-) Transcript_15979:464-709(-)
MTCCSALLRLLLGMHLLRSFGHVHVPTDVQEPKRSAMNIPEGGKYRSHLLEASMLHLFEDFAHRKMHASNNVRCLLPQFIH